MNLENEPLNSNTDDYLWDPSAEPTPEVRRLEKSLAPLRHPVVTRAFPSRSRRPVAAGLTVLVILIMTISVFQLAMPRQGLPIVGVEGLDMLRVGRWIEPDAEVSIHLDDLGTLTVAPRSRLRLLETNADEKRLELTRGSIEAFVAAPPRMFFVETPSGTAVDLGCAYTLAVDDAGVSTLAVSLGWVALESNGRVATVPGGASCRMDPERGPGIPVFDDAGDELKSALNRLDTDPDNAAALDIILAVARTRDSLSLYHLLNRGSELSRGRVADRLHELVPMPSEVTRNGILENDGAMLYRWWNVIRRSW